MGYPVVVKPLSGSGKVGVSLVEDESHLRSWMRPLLTQGTNERGQAIPPGILVETYFAGREFSIECFHGSPVAVCEKQCSPPHFVEATHVTPPIDLPDSGLTSLYQLASDALLALGLTWGAAHVEAKMNSKGELAIVEVNPRLAGGNIPLLVTAATGVDLIRCSLEASLGMPVNLKPTRCRAAAIAFVFAREEGELRSITGMNEARCLPGVNLVRAYPRRSSTIRLKNDFRDRIAYVIAEQAEPERAFATAVEAAAHIHLEIES